ncbi:uncharacterized protein LOC124441528 [Xenia sp. Carnegie-2017]|uniref:uncharacterized protein LOC124441528 n=1 Tax=Xenia sp. Carnegie-2017 TaxID=2897299 RepID=UPI001F041186|nr:uncharacterized protein LOC124441528 [Xenia sp. Carnegie-2017]
MVHDEGYLVARKLFKENYGQNYRIATAYLQRIMEGPLIRAKDGEALRRFSVLLISCKNTLKEIGYLNKLDNLGSLQNIIRKLPYSIRQKWCDIADDITSNKKREVTFEDISRFVEVKARALNHPIFGKINNDSKVRIAQDPKFPRARSNTSFSANQLLEELGISGEKTIVSLTTLRNENTLTECHVVELEVFYLNEISIIELPTLFSTKKLPVDESSILTQADIDR